MKLLIVDDEKIVSDFFVQLAKLRGYTDIDAVASGEEALTRVIRHNYNLITLDIQMPGVSGLEIIAMLRNMCPHAVIAIISGFIPEEISTEIAGCADVIIPKPVNIETFHKLLDSAAQIEEAIAQLPSLGIDPSTRQVE